MSLNVALDITGMEGVLLRFEKLPDEVRAKLKLTIGRLTQQLLSRVRSAEPSRTGRLRSATHAYVDERQSFVRGRVRIRRTGKADDLGAAFGALEYGGPGKKRSGPVTVRAYSRNSVRVRSYRRGRPHIVPRRFLRGPAAAMRPRIRAELEAAIGQAINQVR